MHNLAAEWVDVRDEEALYLARMDGMVVVMSDEYSLSEY